MAVAFGGGLLAQDWNRDVLMLRPAKVVGEKTVLDELRNRAEEALSVIRRARTSHEADAARAALRHRLEESLGFRLLPRDPVLSARVAGTLERDDYRIEKIVYDAGYAKVSAHLYTPRPTGRPFPAVLFYPGHWWEGKALADFQVFCINMARMGFAVLIWDPFGQGERGVSTRDHRRAEAL